VLGAAGTAVYRGQIDDALPAALPPEPAQAARDTLGAAVAAGDELPDGLASAVVDAAREAFTEALQLAATLNAVIAVGAALLAAALLHRVLMSSELEAERGLEPDRTLASGRPC
jgi:MFS transporter, DHA2 family, multidrug resistance protein